MRKNIFFRKGAIGNAFVVKQYTYACSQYHILGSLYTKHLCHCVVLLLYIYSEKKQKL